MSRNTSKDVAAGKEVQVYTRLSKKDADRLRKAAKKDERKLMTYVRRILVAHLDSLDKGD